MLCGNCRRMFKEKNDPVYEGRSMGFRDIFRNSYQRIHKDAKSLCFICISLWSDIEPVIRYCDPDENDSSLWRGPDENKSSFLVAYDFKTSPQDPNIIEFFIGLKYSHLMYKFRQHFKLIRQDEGRVITYNPDPFRPDKSSSLAFARDCLQKCTQRCPGCLNSKQRSNLFPGLNPTRLMDIRPSNGGVWFLSDTINHNFELQPYVTLSHVWSTHPERQMLKTETMQSFKKGNLIAELPNDFQEAVQIARYLGFEYLWIDSLCIIQDDKEDWARESVRMSGYYTNSQLTLAALEGTRDKKHKYEDIDKFMDIVSIDWNSIPKGSYGIFSERFWRKNFTSHVLFQRGWIFQERILSLRILYFGGLQYFWQCPSRLVCESLPSGQFFGSFDDSIKELLWGGGVKSTILSSGDIAWLDLISSYRKCQLTYARDALAAIAGLAHLYRERIGFEYVSGLWKETLFTDILWKSERSTVGRTKLKIFPSWSWCSVRQHVVSGLRHRDRTFPLVAGLKVESTDLLGNPLRTGSSDYQELRLTGRIFDVQLPLSLIGSFEFVFSIMSQFAGLDIILDEEWSPSYKTLSCWLLPWASSYTRARPGLDLGDRFSCIHCLLLEQDVSGMRLYKRVGLSEIHIPSKPPQRHFTSFVEVAKPLQHFLDELSRKDVCEMPKSWDTEHGLHNIEDLVLSEAPEPVELAII